MSKGPIKFSDDQTAIAASVVIRNHIPPDVDAGAKAADDTTTEVRRAIDVVRKRLDEIPAEIDADLATLQATEQEVIARAVEVACSARATELAGAIARAVAVAVAEEREENACMAERLGEAWKDRAGVDGNPELPSCAADLIAAAIRRRGRP